MRSIYYDSPYFIRKLYGYLPVRLKLGKVFKKEKKIIQNSYKMSREQIDNYLNKKIIETVQFAYNKIPFYKNLYDSYNINISKFNGIKDIEKLPIINKKMLKNSNAKTYNIESNKFSRYKANTGGSTGEPFSFYIPHDHYSRAWAYKVDMWGRAGYKFGDPVLSFRGHNFKNKLYRHQTVYNFYQVDSYSLNEEKAKKLIELIKKENIEFIHGYPSNIVKFFEIIKGEMKSQFKGIFFVSEKLDNHKKSFVKKYTDAKFQPSYEQSEMTILASYGYKTDDYYFYPTYGYPEIIKNGNKVNEFNVSGKLIATTFDNFEMPLIRYETGDMAAWSQKKEKGLENFPCVSEIEGRIGEFLKISEYKISVTSLIYGQHLPIFNISNNIQLYLDNNEILYLLLTGDTRKLLNNKSKIEKTISILNKSLDGRIHIEVYILNDSIRTNSGKAKILLSEKELSNFEGNMRKVNF